MQNTDRWRSDWLDGVVVALCLGTPGQKKVSGDRQRETTHEICCLAAEYLILNKPVLSVRKEQKNLVH